MLSDVVNEALSPRVIEQGSDAELREYLQWLSQLTRYAQHRLAEREALVQGPWRKAEAHAAVAAVILASMPAWLQAEIGGQQ